MLNDLGLRKNEGHSIASTLFQPHALSVSLPLSESFFNSVIFSNPFIVLLNTLPNFMRNNLVAFTCFSNHFILCPPPIDLLLFFYLWLLSSFGPRSVWPQCFRIHFAIRVTAFWVRVNYSNHYMLAIFSASNLPRMHRSVSFQRKWSLKKVYFHNIYPPWSACCSNTLLYCMLQNCALFTFTFPFQKIANIALDIPFLYHYAFMLKSG